VRWSDVALLDEAGFSQYEKRALVALAICRVADAATLCREGEIPTSKIYQAMEKLGALGLVEIQRTRPRLYSALPPDVIVERLVHVARDRADQFAERAAGLGEVLAGLEGRLRGRRTFVDLALGTESHIKRHVARLAGARRRVLSYLEEGDLTAIDRVAVDGFDVLRRIRRGASGGGVDHRIVFGFTDRSAPRLLRFFQTHAASLRHVSGVRHSGEMGHPFHVIDDDTVILSLDHPFVPEGRFASLLVRDATLAGSLAAGFDRLWHEALRDLREVRFLPRARTSAAAAPPDPPDTKPARPRGRSARR
jgi:HTH-type transcriptional regulator, sugar sensing transcriptional regulator